MESTRPKLGYLSCERRESGRGRAGRGRVLLALPERVRKYEDCVHVPEMRYCERTVDNVVDQVSMEGQKRFLFAGLKEAMVWAKNRIKHRRKDSR